MTKIKLLFNPIRQYASRFKEGEEFTLNEILVLGVLSSIPIAIGLVVMKLTMQTVYSIFW